MKNIFIIVLSSFATLSYTQERCGTEMHTKELIKKYPEYAKANSKVNIQTNTWINDHPNYDNKGIITIPIVVHVVWKTSQENISDSQILSQIEILNNDFRRTNIDVINTPSVWSNIAADCEIQFCLANTDPNGNPTSGIERTQTTENSFSMNGDPVMSISTGGKDPWDQDYYLNIWVCNLDNLLGYASQPSSWSNPADGVVIGYENFGNSGIANAPYHKGRTATHEVGHWLNLEHVWGDSNCGDDQVNDTPTQQTDNFGCPAFPKNPNSCGTNNTNGDMFMNYMDYTNDACMNLFTNGQKSRMIAAINQYRPNLLNHNLCNSPTNITEVKESRKELLKIVDLLGREIDNKTKNIPRFYIYNDGSTEKRIVLE